MTCAKGFMLLGVVVVVAAAGAVSADETVRLERAEKGYSVALPKTWEVTEVGGIDIALSPEADEDDVFRENVSVNVLPVPPGTELETLYASNLKHMAANFQDVKDAENADLKLAGMPAKSYTVTHRQQGITVRQRFFFLVKDKRFCVVTCTALAGTFDTWEPTFAAVAKSLKLTDPVIPKVRKFESKPHGFSIEMPGVWEAQRRGGGVVVMVGVSPFENEADRFRENFSVALEELPEDMTLQGYYEVARKNIKRQLRNYKEINAGATKLGGNDARYLIATRTDGDVTYTHLGYVVVKNARGYCMIFTALGDTFERWEPEFEKIARTLKLD